MQKERSFEFGGKSKSSRHPRKQGLVSRHQDKTGVEHTGAAISTGSQHRRGTKLREVQEFTNFIRVGRSAKVWIPELITEQCVGRVVDLEGVAVEDRE